jgi:hypothetical protein
MYIDIHCQPIRCNLKHLLLESPERFFWIRVCLEKKTHLLGRTKGRFIRLSAHKKSKSLFSCEDSDAPVLNVDSDAPVLIVGQ